VANAVHKSKGSGEAHPPILPVFQSTGIDHGKLEQEKLVNELKIRAREQVEKGQGVVTIRDPECTSRILGSVVAPQESITTTTTTHVWQEPLPVDQQPAPVQSYSILQGITGRFVPIEGLKALTSTTSNVELPPTSGLLSPAAAEAPPVKHTFIHFEEPFDSEHLSLAQFGARALSAPATLIHGAFLLKQTPMEYNHFRGNCKPCAYFYGKDDGCRWGRDCRFCHLCEPGELKKRRRVKDKALRMVGQLTNGTRPGTSP
jgi:hypothetical protein